MYCGDDEILFEPYNDKWYIYIPTRGLISVIDNNTKNDIVENWNHGLPKYVSKHPYINVNELRKTEERSIPHLSINISNGCQLKCQYCYLNAEQVDSFELMTIEEAKDIFNAYIEYLLNNYHNQILSGQDIWLSFFGGAEPTYNHSVFKGLVEYVKQYAVDNNLNIRLRITTNGYYNSELASFISNKFDKIVLSFDGNKISHNLHRKVADGSDSFDTVYNTARIYYKNSSSFSIRITVSSETIQHLRDSLSFFSTEFAGVTVLIGKVSKIGRAQNCNIDYIDDFDQQICNIVDEFKDRLSFTMLQKKRIANIHTCYCGAVRGSHFIIGKDKNIRACAHSDINQIFLIGYVKNNRIELDSTKIEYLRKTYNVCNRDTCKDCIAKYYCSGGCPSTEVYSPTDYKSACKVNKELFLRKMQELLQS